MVSAAFWVCFSSIFGGYVFFNTLLQLFFYVGRRGREQEWKLQPTAASSPSISCWWLPALNLFGCGKPGRHPRHGRFATINILMSASFAGITGHLVATERTRVSWEHASFGDTCGTAFLSCLLQIVLEYYWHRAMHLPFLYARLHKYHHYYKSPQPFDDMFIAPLESLGYDFILFSPAFLIKMPVAAFAAYMAVMGACGILDHSGVRLRLPFGLYDTADHDLHHKLTNVNYGFPVPWLDILHGTYHGQRGGRPVA